MHSIKQKIDIFVHCSFIYKEVEISFTLLLVDFWFSYIFLYLSKSYNNKNQRNNIQTQTTMQDLEIFLSIFAFFFVFYFGAHRTVMNRNKSDVPYLQWFALVTLLSATGRVGTSLIVQFSPSRSGRFFHRLESWFSNLHFLFIRSTLILLVVQYLNIGAIYPNQRPF